MQTLCWSAVTQRRACTSDLTQAFVSRRRPFERQMLRSNLKAASTCITWSLNEPYTDIPYCTQRPLFTTASLPGVGCSDTPVSDDVHRVSAGHLPVRSAARRAVAVTPLHIPSRPCRVEIARSSRRMRRTPRCKMFATHDDVAGESRSMELDAGRAEIDAVTAIARHPVRRARLTT